MQIEELYKIFIEHPSIQTDTRKIQRGDLFFALKGENFNGNLFAQKALASGAAFAVIDETIEDTNKRLIKTDNVLQTLQALAKYHRQQFNIPFIAITGSNGKTTSKELATAVLSTTFKTYTTKGNLNNHIGIPLTILSVKADAEIAVIEMGANHQKEIESYCEYTLPTHGVITNCGKAHLEGFGGIEGVKKGKGELFDYLRANNGTVFIMNDYEYLMEISAGIKTVRTYGTIDADILGSPNTEKEFLEVSIKKGSEIKKICTNLVGEYNLPNVLLAVSIGKYFGVPDEKIKSALENYHPSNSRSQLIENGNNNKIILDAYNANPTSMKAAIENFAKLHIEHKVLMLGGMMELGNESIEEHLAIIKLIDSFTWKNVVLVGGDFSKVQNNYINFSNSLEARDWFKKQEFNNTGVLVKGSRSMQMEKVLEA